jgi:hypothetical protein
MSSYLTEYGFSLSLIVLVVAERVLNAHLVLLSRLIWGVSEKKGQSLLKGYASTQLLGAGYSFVAAFGTSLSSAVVNVVSMLSSYVLWVITAFVVFAGLFVLQEYYPALLMGMVDSWNDTYGPVVYRIFMFPLQIGNIVFTSVIPVYDGFIWMVKLLFHNVVIKSAMDEIDSVVQAGKSIADLFKHLSVQVHALSLFKCSFPLQLFSLTDNYSCYKTDPGLLSGHGHTMHQASLRSLL